MEPNPNFPVVRANNGSAENLTPVNMLQVPDMWHLHVGLDNFGDALEALKGNDDEPDDDKLVALRDALIAIGTDHAWLAEANNLKRCAAGVINTWSIAHDLKRNLSGELCPKQEA